MSEQNQILQAIIFAAVVVLSFIIVTLGYKRYLAITRSQASVLALLSVLITFVMFAQSGHETLLQGIFAAILPLVLIPFLAKLYLKWIGNRLTEAEKCPGMEGIRAWLHGGNLVCALLISVCVWRRFDQSFWGVLALTLMALLAYPVLNMASASSQPIQTMETKTENLSTERERVLKMLDDGKITAQESAELLSALSLSDKAAEAKPSPASPQRKMVLVGLVLLLIGFFLPWFSINLGDEMNRQMGNMQQGMNQMMPQDSGMNLQMPSLQMKTGSVNVAAGDLKYGLGWIVLLIGIAAGALPYLATNLSAQDRQKATLIGLSIGGIILIYLLTQNIRFVSVGILLTLAGYALQFLGTLKEKQLRVG